MGYLGGKLRFSGKHEWHIKYCMEKNKGRGILGRGKGTEECELDLVGVRWEMYVVGCNFRSSLFYKKC